VPGSWPARQLRELTAILEKSIAGDALGLLIRVMQSIFLTGHPRPRVASSFIRRLHRKPSRVARQVALYISDVLASLDHTGAGTIAALVNNLNAWAHYHRTDVPPPTHEHAGMRHRKPKPPGRSVSHGHRCGRPSRRLRCGIDLRRSCPAPR
jgi:hypothetical protein